MHADQVEITTDVVAALVAAQFPDWSALPVRPVTSYGTVNALFRLGEDIVLRFPLQPNLDPELRDDLLTEQANARRIAAYVSVAVPEPLAIGEPGRGTADRGRRTGGFPVRRRAPGASVTATSSPVTWPDSSPPCTGSTPVAGSGQVTGGAVRYGPRTTTYATASPAAGTSPTRRRWPGSGRTAWTRPPTTATTCGSTPT